MYFIKDNNEIYIASAIGYLQYDNSLYNGKKIRILDLSGKIKKEIDNSKDNNCDIYEDPERGIYYMDNYNDNKLNKKYIITSNKGCITSYDYNKCIIYHKYQDNKNDKIYKKFIIYNKENITEIIVGSYDGYIRIWNFDSAELLNLIKVYKAKLFDICFWNDEYLFVGSENGRIKVIDINKNKSYKELNSGLLGLNYGVTSINKINVPQYGECLISQSANQITLWVN